MAGAMTSFRTRVISGVLVAAGAFTLAACGSGTSDADLANGKTKFTQLCGGCHAMEAAGTKGVIGPNLDDAFRGPRAEGFKASHFQGVVKYWIANPDTKAEPKMTANLVTGKDADDVAAYVAANAGLTGADDVDGAPIRPAEPLPPVEGEAREAAGQGGPPPPSDGK